VVGGLLVSTLFTLFLVPALLSLLTQLQGRLGLLNKEPVGFKPGAAASSAVISGLLLALMLLPGCVSAQPQRATRMSALMQDVLAAELESLDYEEFHALTMPPTAAPVELALEGRVDELEAQGGPSSYEQLELSLPPSLDSDSRELESVDLDWAVRGAAEYNLSVRVARTQMEVDAEGFNVAAAKFDTTLFADLAYSKNENPSVVPTIGGIPLGAGVQRSNNSRFSVGSRRLLEGGGNVEAAANMLWSNNRSGGIGFSPDPAYQSGLSLTVTQPLLRGSGALVARSEQTLLRNQQERSEFLLSEDMARLVETSSIAYWDLQQAWKTLAIYQQLTDRGAEIERVLRERQAFDAAPAQYSDALATLEGRRANLVRAGRQVALASDRLKILVNDPEHPLVSEGLLSPTTELSREPYEGQLKRLLLEALRQRPEVERAVLAIEDAELRRRVASNLTESQLDLRVGGTVSALDESPQDSTGGLFEDDHYSFFAELSYALPVGNRAAEARERQALRQDQLALLGYESAVRDVMGEVKFALRQVRTNHLLIGASRGVRLAQTENLRSLMAEREQRRGYSPEFLNLLFQRQEGLALAQLSEVVSLADYNRSLATLQRVLGGVSPSGTDDTP
jgi:hypothetical protein